MKTIRDKADIDVERILTIEETTRHDVIAFLTSLEEKVGPEARFIHLAAPPLISWTRPTPCCWSRPGS